MTRYGAAVARLRGSRRRGLLPRVQRLADGHLHAVHAYIVYMAGTSMLEKKLAGGLEGAAAAAIGVNIAAAMAGGGAW